MKLEVHFFSRLRDIVRAPQISVELAAGASLGDLLERLYADYAGLKAWDAHLLLAVGLDYADRGQPLHPGDIVSIMPPVQGG